MAVKTLLGGDEVIVSPPTDSAPSASSSRNAPLVHTPMFLTLRPAPSTSAPEPLSPSHAIIRKPRNNQGAARYSGNKGRFPCIRPGVPFLLSSGDHPEFPRNPKFSR